LPVFSYRPQSILSQYIDVIWSHEEGVSAHPRERVLPTGTVTLIIDFKNRNALLLGAHSQYFLLDTAQKISFIGVHFKPGGASPFFRLPIGEIQNQILSLDLFWGTQVYQLRDRLLETPDPYARFRLLEQLLFDLGRDSLSEQPALTYAVRAIQSATHARAITDIAEQTGLHHGKFIQAFQQSVGLKPKVFHRVCRFQAALHQIASGQKILGSISRCPAVILTSPISYTISNPSLVSHPRTISRIAAWR
jgi:AraC-like DNA-binding protein